MGLRRAAVSFRPPEPCGACRVRALCAVRRFGEGDALSKKRGRAPCLPGLLGLLCVPTAGRTRPRASRAVAARTVRR